MKLKFYLFSTAFILFSLLLFSCTGQRKLQKGNYSLALDRSINKLKKSAGNQKAAKTLKEAYNYEVKIKMEEVMRLKSSRRAGAGPFRDVRRAIPEEHGHKLVHAGVREEQPGRVGQQRGRGHEGVPLLGKKIEEGRTD